MPFSLFLQTHPCFNVNKTQGNVLETLITSKTRVKLLLKFFMNEQNSAYLRGLEQEFGEGSNAIRLELNKFEKAGLLRSYGQGNKRLFQANTAHPLFSNLQGLVRKYMGIDSIIEHVAHKVGNLQEVWVAGKTANGLHSTTVELVLVGNEIDRQYVTRLCTKAEPLIEKKISFLVFQPQEFGTFKAEREGELLLVWNEG